jgi:hypothetical protein
MFDEFNDGDSRIGFVGTKHVRVQKFQDGKLVCFYIAMTDWLDDDVSIFAKRLK